jgi:hypothetical protein
MTTTTSRCFSMIFDNSNLNRVSTRAAAGGGGVGA